MPFPFIQKLRIPPSFVPVEKEFITTETGEQVPVLVPQDKVLPDPELFKLSNLQKAGVDLQEVKSTVLSPKSVDAGKVVSKALKKAKVESNEKEVSKE